MGTQGLLHADSAERLDWVTTPVGPHRPVALTGGAWTADGAHLTMHGSARVQAAFEQWVADNLT